MNSMARRMFELVEPDMVDRHLGDVRAEVAGERVRPRS